MMRKKNGSIPVNVMAGEFDPGIAIERLTVDELSLLALADPEHAAATDHPHRHDRHSFFLLESGTVHIDIDFQQYKIKAPSIIYLHPDQVHRTTTFKNVVVTSLAIDNEHLHPEYLRLLEEITPAKPLRLGKETFSLLSEAVALAIKFAVRKDDRLYHLLLKDSCNALAALVISLYLAQTKPADKLTRFEAVTKAFRALLEHSFTTEKRPSDYAQKMHLSTPYLNECVKHATGYSVSHHIQQRVVLEAKRLLYHSDQSVKEIAATLGYDDYPYFSRLFAKVAGISASAFRNKNLD